MGGVRGSPVCSPRDGGTLCPCLPPGPSACARSPGATSQRSVGAGAGCTTNGFGRPAILARWAPTRGPGTWNARSTGATSPRPAGAGAPPTISGGGPLGTRFPTRNQRPPPPPARSRGAQGRSRPAVGALGTTTGGYVPGIPGLRTCCPGARPPPRTAARWTAATIPTTPRACASPTTNGCARLGPPPTRHPTPSSAPCRDAPGRTGARGTAPGTTSGGAEPGIPATVTWTPRGRAVGVRYRAATNRTTPDPGAKPTTAGGAAPETPPPRPSPHRPRSARSRGAPARRRPGACAPRTTSDGSAPTPAHRRVW